MMLLILNFKLKYYPMIPGPPLRKALIAYHFRWLPLILKNHLIYRVPPALTAFKGFSTETTAIHIHLTYLCQILYIWLHQKISPPVSLLGTEDIVFPDLECYSIYFFVILHPAGWYWRTCLHFCESWVEVMDKYSWIPSALLLQLRQEI